MSIVTVKDPPEGIADRIKVPDGLADEIVHITIESLVTKLLVILTSVSKPDKILNLPDIESIVMSPPTVLIFDPLLRSFNPLVVIVPPTFKFLATPTPPSTMSAPAITNEKY